MKFLRRNLSQILLLTILALAYGMTIAPDITWANYGADGGDFIAAAATGGIAHPPGYPTYLLLARFFQWLPIGSIAFRTNLLSAVCAILAAVLVADLVRRSSSSERDEFGRWGGFVAGLAFGLSPLIWSQAVITEVYTLNAFFMALILWLAFRVREPRFLEENRLLSRIWLERIGSLILGLALGNHLTIVLLLPPWFFIGIINKRTEQSTDKSHSPWHPVTLASHFNWRSFARRVLWVLLGLSIYLTIPLRARSGSPIFWGDPMSGVWEHLWWLVSAQVYQDFFFTEPLSNLPLKMGEWAGILLEQVGWPGLILAVWGLLFAKLRSAASRWILVWVFVLYSIFALGYSTFDWQFYLIPAILVMAIFLGWGVAALFENSFRFGRWITPVGVIMLAAVVLAQAWGNLPEVDASQDTRAIELAEEVMAGLPQDAIMYTEGAEETFVLWYYHFVLRQRPDIVVIDKNLLGWDWHRPHLRNVYPHLVIPEVPASTWPVDVRDANQRPVCDIGVYKKKFLYCWDEN